MMKELLEYLPAAKLTERQEKDIVTLRFPFLEADKPTGNRRRYPFSVLSAAIQAVQNDVTRGAVFGSSAHKNHLDLNDVSHIIERLEMIGNMAYCQARILPTSRGKNLQIILRHGKLGVSARGSGTVKMENGEEVVEPGYKLLGVDFVTSPATGMTTGQKDIVESTGASVVYSSAKILTEEKILEQKFYLARLAGYRGDWEDFELLEKNKDLIPLFDFAVKTCAFKGTFEDFCKTRRK